MQRVKKAASQKLGRSNQLVEIFSSITDAFFSLDQNWKFIFANEQAEKLFGYKSEELINTIIWDLPHFTGSEFEKKYRKLPKLGKPLNIEDYHVPLKTWFSIRSYPSKNGVSIYFRDINKRKKQEIHIAREEKEIRELLDSIPHLIWAADKNGKCNYLSNQWVEYTGLPKAMCLGDSWKKLIHPKDRPILASVWEKVAAGKGKYDVEYRIKNKNGVYKWFKTRGVALKGLNGEPAGWFGTSTDIDKLKKYEERVQYQALLIELSSDPSFVQDHNTKIQFWNSGAENTYGYTKKEALGKISYKLLKTEFPESRKAILQKLEKKGRWEGELVHTTKWGEKVRVESHWVLVSRSGKAKILVVNRDITYRTKLDRRKDEFISLASHELKTPLTTAKVYIDLLSKNLSSDGNKKGLEFANKANKYLTKINNLIADLLDVSKIQAGKLEFNYEYFGLDDMINEAVKSVSLATKTHTLVIKGNSSKKIYGDKNRLEQVMFNLLSNSVKYSPEGTKIIIETKINKDRALVSVKDFGLGIPKQRQKRVFDRFYRIDGGVKQGLGLGLYISNEVVKRHGGRMWVESDIGKGTTFYFSLPLKGQSNL